MFKITAPISFKPIPFQAFARIGLALFIFSTVLSPQSAQACSCAPLPSPTEALAEAIAVFSGQVTDIQPSQGRLDITFTVDQQWKGEGEETIVVQTPTSTAMCGYGFEVGESYLVYAREHRGRLQTNQCSRTALLSQATDDVSELDNEQSCQ